ncbi:TIGR03086 family protein [Paeniglutamicibacter sp. ABSL32-1]|uniref:TIGR03086 family metal-binding protein n=1 Tax=Paeniglutamicibacter quisquiliarum TaxID=2849498 RepID=UPI001C2CF780|nr:TIGR03086 family metal-binding protein [Paeniglutamicibacter quisquiliarum]MBV1779725.1 TIGR03086 family protein [Paeniglutamicibacter quisquiliarum]
MSIEKSVVLPLGPEAAFELVTRPERLRRWQTVAARMDLRAGGEYRWTITPGHSASGRIQEIEPGKRLVFDWGWEGSESAASTVTVTLEPVEGGTRLTLLHEGLAPEEVAGHTEGWNHFMDRLVRFATDGDAGADDWAALPDPINELSSAEATLAVAQRVLHQLKPSDASLPTPCENFTVVQLVDHLVGSVTGIGKALGVEPADDPAAPAESRVADAAQSTLEAFAKRGLEGTVDMGFAELPATIVANILNLEFLVHAWDLATATGAKIEVAPGLSDYVLSLARNTISPQMRGASFAEETLVDESAASLERLVAFTGREVSAR